MTVPAREGIGMAAEYADWEIAAITPLAAEVVRNWELASHIKQNGLPVALLVLREKSGGGKPTKTEVVFGRVTSRGTVAPIDASGDDEYPDQNPMKTWETIAVVAMPHGITAGSRPVVALLLQADGCGLTRVALGCGDGSRILPAPSNSSIVLGPWEKHS